MPSWRAKLTCKANPANRTSRANEPSESAHPASAGRGTRAPLGLAVPRLFYAPGAGDALRFTFAGGPCHAACARTRPVWRCSSSFAWAGQVARWPLKLHCWSEGWHGWCQLAATATPPKPEGRGHAAGARKRGLKNMGRTQHHTEAQVVVAVAGAVVVAIATTRVVRGVVERTAAHDLSRRPGRVLPPSLGRIRNIAGAARSCKKIAALRAAGEVSPEPPPESEFLSVRAQSP